MYHRVKTEENYNLKVEPPLGWSVSVFGWPAKDVCANSEGFANHWNITCSTIRRPLWSIPHTSQNLAVRGLLADDVLRPQGVHLKVLEVPIPRKHQLSQCDVPTLQLSNRNIWYVGHWLYGAISKVPRLWVHPHRYWLRVKMGGSTTSRATEAKHVRKMFHEVIFPRFETSRMVISNGRSHFIDKTFRAFLRELGAKHNIATPYHP
jgi:hypothetical protein